MQAEGIFGAGSGKKRGPSEAKNSLVSRQSARFIDVIGEGPIRGLADGAKSIILSGVPHQNSNGTYNHTGFEWEERKGEEDQSPSTLVDSLESEHPVNIEVTQQSGPVVQAVLEEHLDGFRVRIRVPQLMRVKDNGDIVPSSVSFSIEWSEADTGAWRHISGSPMTLSGKNNSPYYVDYEFFPPISGPWQIRVTRISEDEESAKASSAIFFDAWVGIISQKFIMPYTAYVAFDVDAEQFGSSIPDRGYDVFGRIIRVPSNFDGDARTYSGFWDGSWKLAWTDDPAWCFLDLVTNRRYGAGYPDNEINIAALYEISKYSSEKIPDGKGGFEPRFSLNVAINTREDAYSLFKKLITSFRGMMYWAGGQLTLTQDCPKPVKYVAAPANTENGAFLYRSTSDESRANTVQVTYNNPHDNDKPDIEVAEHVGDIIRRGMRTAEVQAWGCRSQGQARRVGEWMIYTLHYDTELVSYVAGTDHEIIYPGDVIAIHDPAKTATKRASGRVMGFPSTNKVTLDRPLPNDVIVGHNFCVSDNDRKLHYVKITIISVDRKTITVSAQLPAMDLGHMWVVYADDAKLREYVVTSIKPNGLRRAVTALLYNRSKFPYVERGIALEEAPKDPIAEYGALKGPRYFEYSVYRVDSPGTPNKVRLLVSWTAPENEPRIAFYRLQFATEVIQEPNWQTVYEGRDTSYTFEDLDPTVPVAVRIQTVGSVGNQLSAWQTITNIELSSRVLPPAAPDSLTVTPEGTGQALLLKWTYTHQPTDFRTVEVWRSRDNILDNATFIGQSADGTFRDSNLTEDVFYFYWIRSEVMTDNEFARYSPFRGPVVAMALPLPITDVLDGSITAEKLAEAAVTADKLAGGSVTHEKLAANSVYGDVIVAGSITAREMVLTDYTNALPDAALEGEAWVLSSNTGIAAKYVSSNKFGLGAKAIQFNNPTAGTWTKIATGSFFPVASGEQYRLQFESLSSVSRDLWFRFEFFNEDKVALTGGSGNAYSSAIRTGVVQGSPNVVKHSGSIPVPAGACFAKVGIWANYPTVAAGSVIIGGFYGQRRNAANLIVDGGIVADHLATNSVTANKINVLQLSAISGDFGHMKAGLIASPDNKFIIDLNNKFISIEV